MQDHSDGRADRPGGPAPGSRPAPDAPVEAAEIRDTVRALARPRRTDTPGARAVESELRRRFRELGYGATELGFAFSTLPGRLGLPAAGAALALAGGSAGWLVARERPGAALVAALLGMALALLPLVLLDAALRLPWGRVETVNLLFTREQPRWLVMAHRDTKSQPVPTLVRTAALMVALAAWTGLVVLLGLELAGWAGALPSPEPGAAAVSAGYRSAAELSAVALAAAGLLLSACGVGNASPGALDNGTGLAALLALAARVDRDVGFLVTDGEELGLAGARSAAGRLPAVEGVVNLDGLDDGGRLRIAEGRGGWNGAGALAEALLEDAGALGLPAVRRPLPRFIPVDHEPLAAAGMPALTLLKGDWRSLLRAHRPGDSPDRLTGAGAAAVATLVVRTLGRLTGTGRDTLRADDGSGHSPAQ